MQASGASLSPDKRQTPADGGQTEAAQEKNRKFYRTALTIGCVLVLLVTLCRTAMLGAAYDYDLHYFETGFPLLLLRVLTVDTVLFALAGLILFRKSGAGAVYPPPSSAGTLFSALCGFFLFATAIMQCIYAVCGLEIGRYTVKNSWFMQLFRKLVTGAPTGGADLGQTVQFLALLFAIPGGIYFLYTSFSERPNRKKLAALGIFFLLWSALCLLVVNFDMSLPINSPERLGPLTAFLSVMLFAAAEIRFLLGRGRLSLLFFTGMLTMLFCFSDALPTILYSFAGRLDMGISTIYACAELSLSLYALLRLRSFRHPVEVEEHPASPEGDGGASEESEEKAGSSEDSLTPPAEGASGAKADSPVPENGGESAPFGAPADEQFGGTPDTDDPFAPDADDPFGESPDADDPFAPPADEPSGKTPDADGSDPFAPEDEAASPTEEDVEIFPLSFSTGDAQDEAPQDNTPQGETKSAQDGTKPTQEQSDGDRKDPGDGEPRRRPVRAPRI